jgi:nicotinate-nucleotide adenylyltransferase
MIGVLGGTFDPVHFGHLRPALEAVEALGLEELRIVPVGRPPHRDPPQADARQRLAMVRTAIADLPGWRLDEREIHRAGPSYMVDTLGSIRAEVGPAPVLLLLGADAYAGLDSWHRWERIPELAHLVVMNRPGGTLPDRGPVARLTQTRRVDHWAALAARPAGGVALCPVTSLAISATAIRELIRRGRSPRFLLPEAVRRLVDEWGLYRAPQAG